MIKNEFVQVGDIVNTHGLNGELRILSDSDFKEERFKKGETLFIIDATGNIIDEVVISKYRTHKNFDLITLKGYNHINQVERFKGKMIAIKKAELPTLEDSDGYYHHDIMACDVILDGKNIGNVYKIVPMGGYDLWYIKRQDDKDLIIPFKDEFVSSIDLEQKEIIVQLLPIMKGSKNE